MEVRRQPTKSDNGFEGINSFARTKLTGSTKDAGPRRTGIAAYRLAVDTTELVADPETEWIVSSPHLNLWYVVASILSTETQTEAYKDEPGWETIVPR